MLEEIVQFDTDLFLFLNNLGSDPWDGFWLFITSKWSSIPLYALLLFLSYRNWGLKKTLVMLLAVALLITCTDQLANFFKYGVQRLRPCHNPELTDLMRLVKRSCGGKYGYFSAHATNSFAIAFFFAYLFRSKFGFMGIFLIFWAIFVSYSRIYLGVHFPLDVISGMLTGLILSWLFAKLYIFALQKFHL